MDQHQADKMINVLQDIKDLLQRIESKLEDWQEDNDSSGNGGQQQHRGFFG